MLLGYLTQKSTPKHKFVSKFLSPQHSTNKNKFSMPPTFKEASKH